MNIDTPEGMAEAVAEQTAMIAQLAQGGRWLVPSLVRGADRWGASCSIYMLDQENKRVKRVHGARPELKITRVFEAMGWTVIPEDGEPDITPLFTFSSALPERLTPSSATSRLAPEDERETIRANQQLSLF